MAGLKTGELIKYLKSFKGGSEVSFLIANAEAGTRLRYPVKAVFGITDMETPSILIEVLEGEPLDDPLFTEGEKGE